MSNTNEMQDQWTEMVEEMNDAVADSLEQNMKSQAAFVESWAEAVEDSVPEEDAMAEGIQGYNRAYEVWMDAAEQMFERTTDAAQGEDVEPRSTATSGSSRPTRRSRRSCRPAPSPPRTASSSRA